MTRWSKQPRVALGRPGVDEPTAGTVTGELTDEQLEGVTGGGATPTESFFRAFSETARRTSSEPSGITGDVR